MRIQLRLPLQMQCCNPLCRERAQRDQYYCSDSCYWQVERSTVGWWFRSIFKQEEATYGGR
jgi:hypothetical protein